MVKVENVSRAFNKGANRFLALKEINLTIEKGELVSIMGPSGSGKSTLLNLIAGFDNPTEGTVSISDVEISSLSENKRAEIRRNLIGFVFQSFCLLPDLTACENVMMPLLVQGYNYAEAKKAAITYLKLVGLECKENNRPEELSGGQKQRVAIARALVTNPAVLLADEPTGNLDSKNGAEILNLLQEINESKNQTIIMVTHSVEASNIAHKKNLFKRWRDKRNHC
jgi:putative ABC transport system ATP-binding protein